ncbi:MAG: PKD domain-containing protein, partial [Bacteroidetes bacterium]|nr:PKD domain-containing protein [Bacteroidota bacterium]
TSNAACASPVTATSNTVTMTVTPSVTPSVSIATATSTICTGQSVTFTATPTNGGTTPSYQWQVNAGNVGTNSATFTSTTLANGDVVTVIMTSNASCASPTTATSNSITMTVSASVVPAVSIAASATTICSGASVTFTATPTNGGTTPSYQWQVNAGNVGTNSATFTSTTLNNGDVVTVIMTSNSSCASPLTATSNSVTMIVGASVVPAVSIAASATTICSGASVTFTATPTNGGTTPSYQWQVNAGNVGTNSATFTSTTLNNGDVVTVIMTSNSSCASPVTATSNSVTMIVGTSVVPSVSIVASSSTICSGASVTFTATPTDGGTTPSYQWQVNSVNAGTNSATFTSTTLANGDVVTVIMTSNAACASPLTATSNTVTMTVTPSVTPSVSIVSSGSTICAGDAVTFTATPTDGGAAPSYQWQVNGTNAGTNSATFTTNTLANGDVVTVIMTSNAACASPLTATSNSITITVQSSVVASVAITSSGSTICAGDAVTFTATPSNGGATPSYQWQVNGTNAGTNSDTFTSNTLANGDVVTVIMTSSSSCATGSPATSNSISITVQASVVASVSIAASTTTICSGDAVTFTATPTNGGATPSYQWQVNGTNAGTNSATFTTSTLANGDVVTVIMTSSSSCATGSPATSNSISITVQTSVVPSVSISPASAVICTGDAATFTATPTNGGTTPTYQWQVNGSNAGTNAATFTSSTLNNGDVVTVIMTSNSPCASPTTATSNSATVTVNNCNPPVANFSANQTILCQAGCVNFTDLSSGSPTSWSWTFAGASPATSTSQNPTNVCYSANGSYTVTLIVSNASGSDTLTQVGYITVGQPIPVTISGNTAINACESTTLTASPADGTYSWGPNVNLLCDNCVSAVVSPSATQDYYVTYTSPDGCVDSDTITVVVTNIFTYFMPTGFSPNGDGINDELLVRGRGVDYINLKIYDRIGEKVFETTDLDKGWDGRLLGVPMNNNVFVYMLEVTFCNGETVKEKGSVTLVK